MDDDNDGDVNSHSVDNSVDFLIDNINDNNVGDSVGHSVYDSEETICDNNAQF